MSKELASQLAAPVSIGGLALPAPGAVLAVFSADGGEEITAPVLGLFIRQDVTEHGVTISLDGFVDGGGVENLFPVGDLENFRGFRFSNAADGCKSGGAMECCGCGTHFEVDETSGVCSRCAAGNNLFAAIQEAKGAEV